ncbi:alpha/beta hydrolase [Microbacterium sp. zg.Y1090]|uniref:esterase/lipase family protein n=1 Tax=Microbacterium TaxID=33882 RepID=UPI00214A9F71|nr:MULTISPECIES: alpha/beta hydrolase [unclassified Microbacterium]MCR2812948.1 alpha/beta hydrolase [Microbacterium sp. zg.Y1084]MCR2817243.1 alpha/beta hydrolase [Microbacterium sp. zg.Y1090]MDL5486089.1 alpha/beta hydrolase [Microbacterium sp. zg-Y1211]WIM29267.1 alpha/beta hydrolase [Microbacterium sp. zg-Y1090]
MIGAVKAAAWWARDYAYAGIWQARALLNRTDPDAFLTGTGRPVVVLPGIYETWKFLQPLVAAIHERGHPVHVLDDLHRNERPVVEMAAQVTAYLAERDLADAIVVAHSKGGLVGKQVMIGTESARVRSMLAVATPFGGSRYARLLLPPTLRIFSPRDATILALAAQAEVNARIVSVYGRFDPHIPEGSKLPGAKNVKLETGGHFRILAHPRVLAEFTLLARAD